MNFDFKKDDLGKYFDQSILSQEGLSEEELSEKVLQGFRNWMDDKLPAILEEETAENFEELNQALEEFATTQFSTLTETATADLKQALASAFQNWSDTDRPTTKTSDRQQRDLNDRLTQFFQDDDWSFTYISEDSTFQLAFVGDHGEWDCYAQVREAQRQVLFYSVCAIAIPEPQRLTIAEFLTRANYGMIIGNFELDFADGEIRYKTSIDVQSGTLTTDMIKQLVYVNVLTMDRYLPGILGILEQDMTPEAAINQIEASGES